MKELFVYKVKKGYVKLGGLFESWRLELWKDLMYSWGCRLVVECLFKVYKIFGLIERNIGFFVFKF